MPLKVKIGAEKITRLPEQTHKTTESTSLLPFRDRKLLSRWTQQAELWCNLKPRGRKSQHKWLQEDCTDLAVNCCVSQIKKHLKLLVSNCQEANVSQPQDANKIVHVPSFLPKYCAKYQAKEQCHQVAHGIIGWILPVRTVLLPKVCNTLAVEILCIFCRKRKIAVVWWGST